jgi:hypothetical protein
MRNVYEIRYEALIQDLPKKAKTWVTNNESLHVLANGSAKAAIEKAERHLLKKKDRWTDDDGKKRLEICLKVRVTSCERLVSIDV